MDLRKLKTLIDLVSESSISELEITEAEGKVRIVKAMPTQAAMPQNYGLAHPGAAGATPGFLQGSSAVGSPSPASMPAEPPPAEVRSVKSPMVGTFYRSASPGAKAFVDVGTEIKAGQPVCIVEAMKIMNEIESELDGRIVKVLCENGQAVEFGQPLFIVE